MEDYADRNFGAPLATTNCSVIAPTAGGRSDIGADFVKVTVESDSPSFFAKVLRVRGASGNGIDGALIRAQSIAKIGYLGGARSPVPWGLPILLAERVTVNTGGGEQPLVENGSEWQGTLPYGSFGPVTLNAYNGQTLDPNYPAGVPEEAVGAGRIVNVPASLPFSAIQIARRSGASEHPNSVVFTSGAGETVVVYVTLGSALPTGQSLKLLFGNERAMTEVTPTLWRGEFAAPTTDELSQDYTFGLRIKNGGQTVSELNPAGGFLVRRSTFPIRDVTLVPSAITSVTPQPVSISVKLNDYEYGNRYELKVVGGAGEVGNYMALDFHTLRHTPYWRLQDPVEYPDMPSGTQTNYYPYIEGVGSYSFVMHIGDAIWTQPGNLSGPQTRAALIARFGGEVSDFDAWVAAGKPKSNRLVTVPIVEKIQETNGASPLRIVSFGVFYVEQVSTTGGGATVMGRFVEYAGPGLVVVDDPPGPLAIEAAHLTADGLDF